MRTIISILGVGVGLGTVGVIKILEQRDEARRLRDEALDKLAQVTDLLERATNKLEDHEKTGFKKPIDVSTVTEQDIAELIVERRAYMAQVRRDSAKQAARSRAITKEVERLFNDAPGQNGSDDDLI